MKKKRYCFVAVMVVAFLISVLSGCRIEETDDTKKKDLDYTICDESKLPVALVELIQEKKKEPFKLSYRTKDYLYIVVGYGAQDRADLSIHLKELYLTDNAILVETELQSLENEKLKEDKLAYPWIAVKCQLYEEQVIFE